MSPARLALISTALLLAGPAGTATHEAATARLAAQVRFANQLNGTHTWTLVANRVILFDNIPPGTTTRYIPVTDSTATLTLHRDGGDSVFATTHHQFVAGSYYTVTSSHGDSERPVLAVVRDPPPRDTMP